MLHTVEITQGSGDLVSLMKEMRTWLDRQRVEPDAFRHSVGGAEITFRVEFKREPDALDFARAFGGRLVGAPAAQAGAPDPLLASATITEAVGGDPQT